MNMKFKRKLAYASLCVGAAALMSSSSVVNAAPFSTALTAITMNVLAPTIVATITTPMSFGGNYLAIPGGTPLPGNASVIISTAGLLTPSIGNSTNGLLMAVSTTGKSALKFSATGGIANSVMTITLDDGSIGVGASPSAVVLNTATPLVDDTFTLNNWTQSTTVGSIAGWVGSAATGATGTATLSGTGALTANFGATLTMNNIVGPNAYTSAAYDGMVRVSLDY